LFRLILTDRVTSRLLTKSIIVLNEKKGVSCQKNYFFSFVIIAKYIINKKLSFIKNLFKKLWLYITL